jgi:hypothetical protein
MNLNHLSGWRRLALVLSAIYWVVATGYAFNMGAEVGSQESARLTAANPWQVVAETPATHSKATPPAPKAGASGETWVVESTTPISASARRPSVDQKLDPPSAAKQSAEKFPGPARQSLPSAEALFPTQDQRWHFAFPIFAVILGIAAAIYAAVTGLVWAGAGFRRQDARSGS